MDYNVIIISEDDLPDDPAFVYPFKANKIEDFEAAGRKSIAEWRRQNPHWDFVETGCTMLIEKVPVSVRKGRRAKRASPVCS